MKTRIVRRYYDDGRKRYIIQAYLQTLLGTKWCDGNKSSIRANHSHTTLEGAKVSLKWFDGTNIKDKVVYQGDIDE